MDPRCRTVVLGFASFLFVMKGALAQLPAGKLIQGVQIAGQDRVPKLAPLRCRL